MLPIEKKSKSEASFQQKGKDGDFSLSIVPMASSQETHENECFSQPLGSFGSASSLSLACESDVKEIPDCQSFDVKKTLDENSRTISNDEINTSLSIIEDIENDLQIKNQNDEVNLPTSLSVTTQKACLKPSTRSKGITKKTARVIIHLDSTVFPQSKI